MNVFKALSLILLSSILLHVQAHGHDGHGNTLLNKTMIEKELKDIVPVDQLPDLMDKTIVQIIAEYANHTNIKSIMTNMSLSQEMIDALNATSFGMVQSCLNDSDIDVDESLKEILETISEKFELTEAFKEMKMMRLKAAGLGNVVSAIGAGDANNSLAFCLKFSMALAENYTILLAREASLRTNLNATEFENAYKNLNVTSEMLRKFIMAKFTADEKYVLKLQAMIKNTILNTFDEKRSLKKKEKLLEIIEKDYNLPEEFVTKELATVVGMKQFIVVSYEKLKIEETPDYKNDSTSIKDLIQATLPIDGILETLFSQPIGVVARGVINWKKQSDFNKITIVDITAPQIGIVISSSKTRGHVTIEWLVERYGFTQQLLTLSHLIRFDTLKGYKEMPFKHFLSIKLIDYIKLYDESKKAPNGFPIVTKEAVLALGKKSFAENGALLFPAIPMDMIKIANLAEDFNVQHFATILETFFEKKNIVVEVPRLHQVVKFFMRRYTGKYLESLFGPVTLGELVQKIVTTHGAAFASLVIDGNIQQTVELCAGSGANILVDNIIKISEKCIGVPYNRAMVIDQVQQIPNLKFSQLEFEEVEKLPLAHLLIKLKMRNTSFHEQGNSIRELLVLSSAPYGFLLAKPIKEFVNISNPHNANITIVDVVGKGRSKFDINETSDIQLLYAWLNHPDLPQQMTLQELAAQLGQGVEKIGESSLAEILNLIKARAHKPFGIKLPTLQLLSICNITYSLQTELNFIIDTCIKDESLLNILGYPKIKAFNLIEILKLSGGLLSRQNLPNLLGIVDIANKGFDQIIQMTAQPLVLLAREKNISLAQLKNQSMETTLIQIFDADETVIRKVFSDINDQIYKLVSETPLIGLVDEDSGLKSVEELYTGSVQTMAATILANETSEEALEKHLPRYVLMISKMKFIPHLFYIYETSDVKLQDISLLDIVHHFFGNFSTATFKKIFEVDGKQFATLQKVTFKLALATYQNSPDQSSHNVATLYGIIKFAADVEPHPFEFLSEPISGLFKAGRRTNSTIQDLKGYNSTYVKPIQAYIPDSFKSSAKDDIVKYLMETQISALAQTFRKDLTQIEKFDVVKLVRESVKAMNECAIITDVCPKNGFCTKEKRMKPFVCECNDGYSGNGKTCEDACKTKKCGGSKGVCINDVNGPVCRCENKYVFDKTKGKCKSTKQVFKIKGLKFRENYDADYANTKSKKFLKLIERLEPILLRVLQKKYPNITNFIITAVTKGSIVVDGEVFTDDKKITATSVKTTFEEAAQTNDTDLNLLNPATNFTAQVDEANPCKPSPCGEHASCNVTDAVTHSCICNEDYEMNGDGNCEEEDDNDLALKVALPVCLILALLIIIGVIVCCSKKKNKQEYKTPETEMRGAANAGYDR